MATDVAVKNQSDSWLSAVEGEAEVITLAAQMWLPLTGKFAERIFVVRAGMAFLEWRAGKGLRRVGQLFYPGDVIQAAMFPKLPNVAVTAGNDVVLDCLELRDLRSLLCASEATFRKFEDHQARQQARLTMHNCALGGMTADARVAALLIELACRIGKWKSGQVSIILPMSRLDIADHLAINADTVSRITSKLRELGVLTQVGRERVFVTGWKKLLDLCPLSGVVTSLHNSEQFS